MEVSVFGGLSGLSARSFFLFLLLLRGIHRVAIVSNWASPGKQDGRCGIHRKYA